MLFDNTDQKKTLVTGVFISAAPDKVRAKLGFRSKCRGSCRFLFSLLFCLWPSASLLQCRFPVNPQSPNRLHFPFSLRTFKSLTLRSRKMAKILEFSSLLLFLTLLNAPLSRASIPHRRTVSRAQNGVVGTELWCVAKNNAEDTALQASLDWACGPGAADCGPIQQGGPCYDPNDIQATASFAFNDYYLRHGLADDSCFFDNNAALTSLNPSHDKCKFPSSLSVNNVSFSGPATTVGMGPSEDMSSCSQVAQQWFWPVITCLVFIFFDKNGNFHYIIIEHYSWI